MAPAHRVFRARVSVTDDSSTERRRETSIIGGSLAALDP